MSDALREEIARALDRALAFDVESDARAGETTHEERIKIADAILPIIARVRDEARAEFKREADAAYVEWLRETYEYSMDLGE